MSSVRLSWEAVLAYEEQLRQLTTPEQRVGKANDMSYPILSSLTSRNTDNNLETFLKAKYTELIDPKIFIDFSCRVAQANLEEEEQHIGRGCWPFTTTRPELSRERGEWVAHIFQLCRQMLDHRRSLASTFDLSPSETQESQQLAYRIMRAAQDRYQLRLGGYNSPEINAQNFLDTVESCRVLGATPGQLIDEVHRTLPLGFNYLFGLFHENRHQALRDFIVLSTVHRLLSATYHRCKHRAYRDWGEYCKLRGGGVSPFSPVQDIVSLHPEGTLVTVDRCRNQCNKNLAALVAPWLHSIVKKLPPPTAIVSSWRDEGEDALFESS